MEARFGDRDVDDCGGPLETAVGAAARPARAGHRRAARVPRRGAHRAARRAAAAGAGGDGGRRKAPARRAGPRRPGRRRGRHRGTGDDRRRLRRRTLARLLRGCRVRECPRRRRAARILGRQRRFCAVRDVRPGPRRRHPGGAAALRKAHRDDPGRRRDRHRRRPGPDAGPAGLPRRHRAGERRGRGGPAVLAGRGLADPAPDQPGVQRQGPRAGRRARRARRGPVGRARRRSFPAPRPTTRPNGSGRPSPQNRAFPDREIGYQDPGP